MDITNTISNPDFIPTDTNLVLIGIAIMIILSFVFYKLYDESRYDSNGNRLSVKNTMKNMCGLYPLLRNTISKSTVAIQGKSKQLSDAVGEKSDELIKKLSLRRKEVFNIDNNAFTYNQAKKVCKAYGAKLATYVKLLSHIKMAQIGVIMDGLLIKWHYILFKKNTMKKLNQILKPKAIVVNQVSMEVDLRN